MNAHLHHDDDALLELALLRDPRTRERHADVASCAACWQRMVELERAAARQRAALADDDDRVSAARVAERVLDATVRPVEVARSYPWSRARVLRWLAASVVLHAFALPALGYLAWKRAQPEPVAGPGATEIAAPEADGDPAAPAGNLRELAFARIELQRFDGPSDALHAAGSTRIGSLLAARSSRLARGKMPDLLLDEAFLSQASRLERALWLEVLLDDFVLSRTPRRPLFELLQSVSEQRAGDGAVARLERLALARAASYGLFATAEPLPARDEVFDRDWFEAMGECVAMSHSASDPAVRAWSAWGLDDPHGARARQ